MWLCRGFPQCTDVSQVKGSLSVVNQQQKAMKTAVDVVRSQQHKSAKQRVYQQSPAFPFNQAPVARYPRLAPTFESPHVAPFLGYAIDVAIP